MEKNKRIISFLLCFVISLSGISSFSFANAGIFDGSSGSWRDVISNWIDNSSSSTTSNTWNQVDNSDRSYTVNNAQNYYTSVTSSVVDKSGNVTNYYRGGDTTNTKIIDSYNKTFNTVYNTTNTSTTNNYKANVKLENFLNQYTTNNVTNNNTYSATYKSWYYDNRTNNYNYTQNNDYNYYNTDNSRYYISIDNSTDEYYLIDVQYSPTFVTVNYTYNTTNINNEKVGDVTNVYYYELKDGRNSSSLTAAEVAGMDFGYDVRNYGLVTDDPNTLSLQHFDGDYTDSSSYNRSFYSENRSTQYVDSGAFGQAVKLSSGSAAGVTIPNLSSYDSLSFDFRVYYADISHLGIYLGSTNLFREILSYRKWIGQDTYSDDGDRVSREYSTSGSLPDQLVQYAPGSLSFLPGSVNTLKSAMSTPVSSASSGYREEYPSSKTYGWYSELGSPVLYSSGALVDYWSCHYNGTSSGYSISHYYFLHHHYVSKEYRWTPPQSIQASFSYDSYKNQWVSMRITIANGNLYYFVNGDLVGSGSFTKPTADKFYIKSTGTVYLDELRVTTGNLSSTSAYTPPSAPYDTNKVLALPDELKANTIYVQHTTPVTNHRIGGVRPSNPEIGFFYIPLYDDNTGGQPQLYDGSNWVNVTAMVYDGKTLHDAKGFKFSPVGSSPDVDVDAKPERPSKPGDDADPDSCTHDWEEDVEALVSPTCTLAGSKTFVCSKCEKTKKESIPLLDHDWKVKATIPNQYDEEGNQISVGFTIFECLRGQEQYKSVDGTAPPALNPGGSSNTPGGDNSGDGEEKEGFLAWLLRKAGELLGSIGEGLINFLKGVLEGIFDGLISLVTGVLDSLTKIVDLFGSFGEALGVLWTWLPPEIMAVLVAGVSVFVLVALLKLFMK